MFKTNANSRSRSHMCIHTLVFTTTVSIDRECPCQWLLGVLLLPLGPGEPCPKAVFFELFTASQQLTASLPMSMDLTWQLQIRLNDALDITHEISKLLKYSPRRDTIFEKLKEQLAPDLPGFQTLCPTRWTVKASSLESVLNNYKVFQALWQEAQEVASDSESHTGITRVEFKMGTFPYLFGVLLGP